MRGRNERFASSVYLAMLNGGQPVFLIAAWALTQTLFEGHQATDCLDLPSGVPALRICCSRIDHMYCLLQVLVNPSSNKILGRRIATDGARHAPAFRRH